MGCVEVLVDLRDAVDEGGSLLDPTASARARETVDKVDERTRLVAVTGASILP